jgi:RNA polymerase sigma-70 factor (ECF subfamily)
VELAQRGDQAAFAEIALAVNSRLFAVAHRILRDFHLAEDATQQAIVLIWRDLPKLGDPGKFDAWAYRVLVNTCYRQARRSRAAVSGLRLMTTQDSSTMDAEAAFADRDMVSRAIDQLSLEQRAVLVLQYYLQLGHSEIADVLGIPLGTVKSRSSNARNALRAVLEAQGRPGIARWSA